MEVNGPNAIPLYQVCWTFSVFSMRHLVHCSLSPCFKDFLVNSFIEVLWSLGYYLLGSWVAGLLGDWCKFGGISPCSYRENHVPVIVVGENVWEIEFYR